MHRCMAGRAFTFFMQDSDVRLCVIEPSGEVRPNRFGIFHWICSNSPEFSLTTFVAPSALVNAPMTGLVRLLFATGERSEDREPTAVFVIMAFHTCYPLMGLRHFCVALTVAREFRLCLQPRGLLRVQSLHLPHQRLGSALSGCDVSIQHEEEKRKQRPDMGERR